MDQAKESETVAPQFMDGMKQMLEVFAQTMASVVQQQEQMNAQLVAR
jgi:hypothetical protein